jgi:hypothetical protein
MSIFEKVTQVEITVVVGDHNDSALEIAKQEVLSIVKSRFYDVVYSSYQGPTFTFKLENLDSLEVNGVIFPPPIKAYAITIDITNEITKTPNTSLIDIEMQKARAGIPLAIDLTDRTPPVANNTQPVTANQPPNPSPTAANIPLPASMQDKPPESITATPVDNNVAKGQIVSTPSSIPKSNDISKNLTEQNSVSLVFPLQTEVTLKISDWPNYIQKLTNLFDFYKKQMALKNIKIDNYDLSAETGPLLTFLPQLSAIIAISNSIKPVIATNPEKLSALDYEYLTLRILDNPPEVSAFSPQMMSGSNQTPNTTATTSTGTPQPPTSSDGFESTRKILTFKVNRLDSSILSQLESFCLEFAKVNYYDQIFSSYEGPIIVTTNSIQNKQFASNQSQVSLGQLVATGNGPAYEITIDVRNAVSKRLPPTESVNLTQPFNVLVENGIDTAHLIPNAPPPQLQPQPQTGNAGASNTNQTQTSQSGSANSAGIMPVVADFEKRTFSDGSEREVRIYNRIDYCFLTNQTTGESLLVSMPINAGISGLSATTLSLVFNMLQIINNQMNPGIPSSLLLCNGTASQLGKLQQGATSLSVGVSELFGNSLATSKVLLQDFLAGYTHPWRTTSNIPFKPFPKGCSDEMRIEIARLQASIQLYKLQRDLIYGNSLVAGIDPKEQKKHEEEKARLAELNKICPDLLNTSIFNSLELLKQNLQNFNLGKLYSEFLNKINLPCIVDEALKCVMPQLPCEDILRDLTVENFELRMQMAFPHAQNLIHAFALNIREGYEKENARRAQAGEAPLDPAGEATFVLDGINKFIDLEALCKIDLNAIIALIKALFNIKLPEFNFFDWQFYFKIDFDLAMLNAILQALLAMIQQILNELLGCDAFLNLIAGLVNENVQAPTGLYGDIAALFQGDTDFSNTNTIMSGAFQNFLSGTADEFAQLIKFELGAGHPIIGNLVGSGTLGPDLIPNNNTGSVGVLSTQGDFLGGLFKTSTLTSGSYGTAGFQASDTQFVGTFDTTALATNEGQANFLKEIGKFQVAGNTGDGIQSFVRISDDSVVNLMENIGNSQTQTNSQGLTSGNSSASQGLTASGNNQTPSSIALSGSARQIPMGFQQSKGLSTNKLLSLEKNDIFTPKGLRNKNRHILNALAIHNEQTKTTSVVTTQKELVEQIKDFVRTTFSLLSPSEVIDLVSGRPTEEVKTTLVGITQIRYPIINTILQYPERHALMFASFGKILELDTVGPRLQLLASNPKTKRMMVDPNVCAPYNNVYDFRKSLMEQTLPPALANKLMDDLVEDDRKRANDLMSSLAKGIRPNDILNNPNLLKVNKTLDGKPIEEVDKAINDSLSNIFDKVKIKFDEELETFPNAVSTSIVKNKRVYQKIPRPTASGVYGFKAQENEDNAESDNLEYKKIDEVTQEEPKEQDGKKYFSKQDTEKVPGGLYKKAFEKYDVNYVKESAYSIEVEATGLLSQDSETDPLSAARESKVDLNTLSNSTQGIRTKFLLENIERQSPEWNLNYFEVPDLATTTDKYYFSVKTRGTVQISTPPHIQFQENSKFSGSLADNSAILQEIEMLPSYSPSVLPQWAAHGRIGIFTKIGLENISKIYTNEGGVYDEILIKGLRNGEMRSLYSDLISGLFEKTAKELVSETTAQDIETDLLREVPASSLDDKLKTSLINLIDFTPLQTPEQKACGIDPHLLQIEAVKKRIQEEYNNTIPENLINTNSRINTRYTDDKPGHLSEKIMTGLAETFIRTSVIHNLFKGLFILSRNRFNLTKFGILEIVYSFLESRVKSDVNRLGLSQDFEKEYIKIYDLYKKQQPPLISQEDTGINKLKSIIRYHVDSVVEHLSKLLNIKEKTDFDQLVINLNAAQLGASQFDLGGFRNNSLLISEAVNKDAVDTKRREAFFNSLEKYQPYSNFWTKNTAQYTMVLEPPRRGDEEVTPITEQYGQFKITAFTPHRHLISNIWNDVLDNWEAVYDPAYPDFGIRKPKIILEKYVRIEKSDTNSQTYVQLWSNAEFRNLISRFVELEFDGVISLENYSILVTKFETLRRASIPSLSGVYLYKDPTTLGVNEFSYLKSPPKFGMRVTLLKEQDKYSLYNTSELEDILELNGGFIHRYSFMGGKYYLEPTATEGACVDFKPSPNPYNSRQLTYNMKEKIGFIQPFYKQTWDQRVSEETFYETYPDGRVEYGERVTNQTHWLGAAQTNAQREAENRFLQNYPNSIMLVATHSTIGIIPLVIEETVMPLDLYNYTELADRESSHITYDIMKNSYDSSKLDRIMKNNYKFDLLVNYCLPTGIEKTFALMNSMVGMANEQTIKLLDGTKEVIKNSYIVQRDSGKFKKNPKSGKYEKSKQSAMDGPLPADFAKAAVTIPISILKGVATSVDPNIFLADKIVLAGKMGFIQPKYRRLSAGEKYRLEGTRSEYLEISEPGIATKGMFKYEDGELVIRSTPTDDNSYETDYTYVAQVQNKRILKTRDSEGNLKYVVKQGLGFVGVPVNRQGNEFTLVNQQVDEENVGNFDILPSTVIYPGEKINIPYALASVLLAPFPLFQPPFTLTAYNMVMPFGPTFLGLEPLLFETQQFKTAKVKQKGTPEDTSGNISCEPKRLSEKVVLTAPTQNPQELILQELHNIIINEIIPEANNIRDVLQRTSFIKERVERILDESNIQRTERQITNLIQIITSNRALTIEQLRDFVNN